MKELIYRGLTSILLLIILFYTYKYLNFFILVISFVLLISMIEYSQLIFKIKKNINDRVILIIPGLIYTIIIFVFLFINIFEYKNIIFYFLIICIVTDIGGLISGKIFKGKKLTKISPKKTYSGLYGSFIIAFVFMFLFKDLLILNNLILFTFTFSVCLLSQLGDLFFSYLKRQAKVKDTGKLLPGHGGILDRVDGIIISVPINIFFYTLSIWSISQY